MPVLVGTSGWQYRDWRGRFYPPGLPARRWLEHHAAAFATTEVNNLHNIVHLLIGVALLAASRTTATARTANLVIGVAYLGLAVLGPFLTGTEANILALNSPDHVLHLLSGLVLTGVGALADKTSRVRT